MSILAAVDKLKNMGASSVEYKTIGLRDNDLIKIFEEWKKIIEYTAIQFTRYPPYTFTEAANTGFIVGACGRLNYGAVQEYRTKSKINGKINYGRGDLLIFISKDKAFRVEAKQFIGFELTSVQNFSHIKRKRKKNLLQIDGYMEMMMKNCESEDYISLMYITPQIKESQNYDSQTLKANWESFLTDLRHEYDSESSFIVSYLSSLDDLMYKYDTVSKCKNAYPGIAILGDIIKVENKEVVK